MTNDFMPISKEDYEYLSELASTEQEWQRYTCMNSSSERIAIDNTVIAERVFELDDPDLYKIRKVAKKHLKRRK